MKVDQTANQIAAHIVNGDYGAANTLFNQSINDLKYFEAVVLRDKVHKCVKEIEDRR